MFAKVLAIWHTTWALPWCIAMIGRLFLEKYETVRLLGEGGMGRAYLARQLDLGRHVVVKVMHEHLAADLSFRERFQQEILLMARFQHPHAVALLDASLEHTQGACIIMEYVQGINLDQLVSKNKGRLSPQRISRLLGQLCDVLQAAHNEGIIHRDLKPSNLIVIDADTPYEKIKVMDFGLAKRFSREAPPNSAKDYGVGSPRYMSPEQAQGLEQDHRSDLYSVGVILYELLTGRLPFIRDSLLDFILAHTQEKPPAFAEIGEMALSTAVESVIMACLAKDPAQRPASARALYEHYLEAVSRPEETSAPAALAPTVPEVSDATLLEIDASAVVYHMEAYMPAAIAEHKVRGFVNEVSGEVKESIPGLVRVYLGKPAAGLGPWLRRKLGMTAPAGRIEMFLRLRPLANRPGFLKITVILRALDGPPADPDLWHARCADAYGKLRAFLMGVDHIMADGS